MGILSKVFKTDEYENDEDVELSEQAADDELLDDDDAVEPDLEDHVQDDV